MVTPTAAMEVVRAARPVFRCAHDGITFAANAAFLADGYSLCAVGPAALTASLPADEEEVGIDGWNSMDNCYAFLYSKEEGKKCILLKCVVIGDFLAIDALDLQAHHKKPCHVQINLLVELDGKDATAAQNPDVVRSWSINSFENIMWENLSIRTREPASSGNVPWENVSARTIEPTGPENIMWENMSIKTIEPAISENVVWKNLSITTTEPSYLGNVMRENLSTRTTEPASSRNILLENQCTRSIEPVGSPSSPQNIVWKDMSIRTIEPSSSENVLWKNLSIRTTEPICSGNFIWENLSTRTTVPASSPSNPENILWKNTSIRTIEPASSPSSSENVLWENLSIRSTQPTSLTYPPMVLFGYDDTFPAPSAGFYPHSGGTGGSMHVGLNYPCVFPSNPSTPVDDSGSVPHDDHYNPIGPSDVPGFEPSCFVRRSRHLRHSGGNTHPNLEFFQQGPDFF